MELLVITSDRGLCGSFNTSIIRRAEAFMKEEGRGSMPMHVVGRRAREYFKRRPVSIVQSYSDVFRDFGYDKARDIGQDMVRRFVKGKLDAVYMVYNEFKSAIQQQVVVERLLPLQRLEESGDSKHEYLFEPPPEKLLDDLLHHHVNVQLWAALLESNAAENGARMSAMDAATKNAGELIEKLTLQMNRIRQAAITKEIIEVVSGADALA